MRTLALVQLMKTNVLINITNIPVNINNVSINTTPCTYRYKNVLNMKSRKEIRRIRYILEILKTKLNSDY